LNAKPPVNLKDHAEVVMANILDQQLAAGDGRDGNKAANFQVIRRNSMPRAASR